MFVEIARQFATDTASGLPSNEDITRVDRSANMLERFWRTAATASDLLAVP
jgi:hypothetical protein